MRTPSLNYLQNKTPKVPQVPQRDVFSSVQLQTMMKSSAEVLGLPVHNESSESRVFLLKDWIAFFVAKKQFFQLLLNDYFKLRG